MLSDEYFTMHLTLQGWVDGSEKTNKGMLIRPMPNSTVFTLTFHETISGILVQPEHSVYARYQIDSTSDMLKILFATFGKLPERFKTWGISVDW